MCIGLPRWMTEEGQSGLDKSWIPFGGGARKCMGYNFAIMEIKVSKQFRPLLLLCSNETFPAGHTLSCSLDQNRLCDLQSASDLEKNFWALFQAILQATVPPHGGRAWGSVTYRMFRLRMCYLLHV